MKHLGICCVGHMFSLSNLKGNQMLISPEFSCGTMTPSHEYYIYSTWGLCEINPYIHICNITYLQLFGIKRGNAESS